MTYYYVRVIEIPTPRHTLYASVDIYFGPEAPKGMDNYELIIKNLECWSTGVLDFHITPALHNSI